MQSSGTTVRLYDVSFTDENTGTAVGREGTILRTTNGGTNWTAQSSVASNDLFAVFFTDANTGTAVGRYCIILRTTNGGISWTTQSIDVTSINNSRPETPSSFILMQNYPNPFNPSTKINYSVPKQSNVKIIVFDALGRKVTTLVNEVKSIGNYTVEFKASHLSSGIYFYQMKTDEFIQTNKLILLR